MALFRIMKPVAGDCQRDLLAQSMRILEEQFIKRTFLLKHTLQSLHADPQRLA
jgi:hypothetical protein